MNYRILTTVLLSSVLVAGCQPATKRDTGVVVGGIAGGVLGNQVGKGSGRTVATIAGTLVGAFIGGAVGQNMDDNDRYRAQQTLENNPVNRTTSWRNPDTGHQYSVTPTRTYESNTGPCREYTTEAIIGGKRETIYGNACRQSDGSWQTSN